MSRYSPPDDILKDITNLRYRQTEMERSNPNNFGTVDEGGFRIKSNGVTIMLIGEFEGLQVLGEPTTVKGATFFHPTTGDFIGLIGWDDITNQTWAEFFMDQIRISAESGDLVVTTEDGGDDLFVTSGDDLVLTAVSDIFMDATGDIFIDASSDVWISALGIVDIDAPFVDIASTSSNLDLSSADDINLHATVNIDLDPDNELRFFIGTTANPANLNQTSNNVRVVASARKYKANIEDAVIDPADVMLLRPRTWVDKSDLQKYENWLAAKAIAASNGEEEFLGEEAFNPVRIPGFIAEELDEHSTLRQFVQYNDDNTPESIYYDRMFAAGVVVMQKQQEKIESLESRIAALEAK